MYNKTLARITATAMAITMVASFGVTSLAADVELQGDQTETVYVFTEQSTQVDGDIKVEEGDALNVYNGEVEVNGSVEGQIEAVDSKVNVTGDVTSNGDESLIGMNDQFTERSSDGLVTARGSETEITIEGDVDASEIITKQQPDNWTHYQGVGYNDKDKLPDAIIKYDTRTVTGGADAGVTVDGGATVNVEGDITGGKNGAVVTGESSLNVGGNVISNGKETVESGLKYDAADGATFYAKEESNYGIEEGSVGKPYAKSELKSNGIYTDGNGSIVVEGDVSGQENGITIDNDRDEKAGSIVVLGTIKGEKYGINFADAASMYQYVDGAKETGESYEVRSQKGADRLLKEIPDITVYAIEGEKPVNDGLLGVKDNRLYRVECYDAYKKAYDSIVSAINYIIKQDDKSNSDYGITVDATKQTINDKEYFTTKINQAFAVAAKLPEGYTISGGENVTVVDNGNGTFSLTLNNLKGGINLKAVLKPVKAADNSSEVETYEVVVEQVSQSTESQNDNQNQSQSGAVVVTSSASATSNPEQAALVIAISGDKPAQTVSFEVGKVSPRQYKEAVINNITLTPANGAFNLVTDKPSVLDLKMVEAISARSDIDVNVVFNYGGKKYKVVIPAGYDVKSLLDKNGYCGFLRLLAVLGGETI